MSLSPRRRLPGAAARSVWPPLPLAAQQDPQTEPVETNFFFFLRKRKQKKNPTKIRAQHSAKACGPSTRPSVPCSPACGPSRRGQLECSAGSPPAPGPRQPLPEGPKLSPPPAPRRRTRGHSPRGCVPAWVPATLLFTYGCPADSPDPPGAQSAGQVTG